MFVIMDNLLLKTKERGEATKFTHIIYIYPPGYSVWIPDLFPRNPSIDLSITFLI